MIEEKFLFLINVNVFIIVDVLEVFYIIELDEELFLFIMF